MQTVPKQMDLPLDLLEIPKQVSLSRTSFFLFCSSAQEAPSVGKQLIAMTNQCWKQQGCKSPHLFLLRVKCLRLSSDEKSTFVELLGRLLVSLGTPKKQC